MTSSETKAVLIGLFKSAKKRIRQSWSVSSEPYKLTGKITYATPADQYDDDDICGWCLRIDCDWYKHGLYVRVVEDRLEVEGPGSSDDLELADPDLEAKFAVLILAYFPSTPLD